MVFKPSLLSTLLLFSLAGACAWLGNWQLDRAIYKQQAQAQFESAPMLTRLPAAAVHAEYARVELTGRFDEHKHFLVDNRMFQGRPGVHVLTPFAAGFGQTILVNRGWLPMAPNRSRLPEIVTPTGSVRIRGHLEALRQPGAQLGEAESPEPGPWPQLLTYPRIPAMARALRSELFPRILYLDADSPGGFEDRDWQPYAMGPEKHRGYALQWFALALTAIIAWGVLTVRRGRRGPT